MALNKVTYTDLVTVIGAQNLNDIQDAIIALEEWQSEAGADIPQILANIAPSFSNSTSYSAGDCVIVLNKLYQFTAAHPAGNWTGADAVEVNVTSLLKEAVASLSGNIDALSSEVGDVKSAVGELDDELYDDVTVTRHGKDKISYSELDFTAGYVTNTGATGGTSTYSHTKKIPVTEGDVLTYESSTGILYDLRYVCAYNGASIVSAKGMSSQSTSYTVPEGVTDVIVTIINKQITQAKNLCLTYSRTETIHNFVVGRQLNILSKTGYTIASSADTLASGTSLVLAQNIDNKKNAKLDVWCKFSEFDSITVGHGTGTYGGYVTVDSTTVTVYYNDTVMETYTHELTIEDFVEVNISQGKNARATITVTTSSGAWTASHTALWHGCKGNIFVNATMNLTDVKYSATFDDLKKDLFIFGDSYLSVGDNARYPYYLNETYKTDNYAAFGFGGASSVNELLALKAVIQYAKPQWLAWFLGMNDGDTSTAVNASWLQCVNEVIDICKENCITLILATIPCTPTINNSFKNQFVRESGYAYVDFAKAVNGESVGATWYTDMLSSDNTHPTALGAKALAARLIADLPQIQ